MKVYKGTDKDMKCWGFQYELGVKVKSDDAIRCGGKGFHSCEAPFDVLRYYPNNDGNRFFVATAGGKIDRTGAGDSKIASSEITLDKEISFDELCTAQIEYTRAKAESGEYGGRSNIQGGDWSNIQGDDWSNIIGGDWSNIQGGDWSNIQGGDWSNIQGGDWSNIIGGDRSNIIGGGRCNIACGNGCNILGRNDSALAGGDGSLVSGRNSCKAKAGINSVIVLTEWKMINDKYIPVSAKAEIVDGNRIKANTWYKLVNGEFTEAE